jgi:hypothetical protein
MRRPLVLATCLLLAGCAAHRVSGRHPGDPLTEPMPSPGQLRALAAAHEARERAEAGAIPDERAWHGVAKSPASQPTRARGADAAGNIRVNQDASGQDQNELVLSVSPADPANLVGGANDYRVGPVRCGWFSSRDGGVTWTDGVLSEPTYPLQGDPAVAHCADGSAVYVCLSFTGAYQPHGLFAYRTTDGGQTWGSPVAVLNRPTGFPFADKEWVACDRTATSPYANRVYVTWTDFGLSGSPILMRRSTDGGRTWSSNVRVSDGANCQGSVISTARNGTVYVAWDAGGAIGFDRSTDGGQTFGADTTASTQVDIPGDTFRRNSFPSMDVDRSNGPYSGRVYVVWSDNRNGDPDVLMVRSDDGGQTWSAPVRVNDDPAGTGRDQFFPWVAVDPVGRVTVSWLDRRRDPANDRYEAWGAVSRDGGQSFDTNFLVADAASDGDLSGFLGDYDGMAATSELMFPFWTDLRPGTGESDAYTDRFPNTFRYDEVDAVGWLDEDTMDFEAQDARFGQTLAYDVASGLLSELAADAGYARAQCSADAWGAPPYLDTRIPPEGDGYWFLVRATGPDGVGTYGDGTPARPNARDPLDETLDVCP